MPHTSTLQMQQKQELQAINSSLVSIFEIFKLVYAELTLTLQDKPRFYASVGCTAVAHYEIEVAQAGRTPIHVERDEAGRFFISLLANDEEHFRDEHKRRISSHVIMVPASRANDFGLWEVDLTAAKEEPVLLAKLEDDLIKPNARGQHVKEQADANKRCVLSVFDSAIRNMCSAAVHNRAGVGAALPPVKRRRVHGVRRGHGS